MTKVRGATGDPLLCCWDDCERDGHEEYKVVREEKNKKLHYIFCTLSHRVLYENSQFSYGNLSPAGPTRTPLGLVIP